MSSISGIKLIRKDFFNFFFFLKNRLFTIKARYLQSNNTKLSKLTKPELAASCYFTQRTRHKRIRTERTHLRNPRATDTAFRAQQSNKDTIVHLDINTNKTIINTNKWGKGPSIKKMRRL